MRAIKLLGAVAFLLAITLLAGCLGTVGGEPPQKKTTTQAKAAAEQSGEAPLMVWVKRQTGYQDNPLQSEFSINGATVDVFTSDTQKTIGKHLKKGWNDIAIETTPQQPASNNNSLWFSIGPVSRDKNDRQVMMPLWKFGNGTDWEYNDGKFSHATGPDLKKVSLSYRVYYAGLEHEHGKVRTGDYWLQGGPQTNYLNVPLTATVFVNDTPLNSFILAERQVVITPLLKKGKNEIKLVSSRVDNAVYANDIILSVAGPAEYHAARRKFEAKPIVEFKAMQGWEHEKKTGQLVSKADPHAKTIERIVPFFLDEAPVVGDK
jgi:hypothetical protein